MNFPLPAGGNRTTRISGAFLGKAARTPIHAEFGSGCAPPIACGTWHRFGGDAVHPDSPRPQAEKTAAVAARPDFGIRASPAHVRPVVEEPVLRGCAQLPRRRLLAPSRAGDLRRNRAAQRIPDAGVGHAIVGPGQKPGMVRIHQPDGRTPRHGPGGPARLQLGLCSRPCDPHGCANHRSQQGTRAATPGPRAVRGDQELLRTCRNAVAHRNCRSGLRSGQFAAGS